MKTKATILFALFVLVAPIFAQEKEAPTGVFETRREYYDFMGAVKSSAAGDPEMQAMIPLINDIVLNQDIGSTGQKYGGESSSLGLLSNADIRRELEVVDDQYKELQQRGAEIQKRMAEELRSIDFKNDNVVAKIQSLRTKAQDEMEAVLLPHQVDRLKQILMQSMLRRRSLADVLTRDPLKTEIEITDTQATRLKQAEAEIEAKLQKQIAELRAKARNELIETLTPKQQKEVKSMFGEAFEFRRKGKDASSKQKSKIQPKS